MKTFTVAATAATFILSSLLSCVTADAGSHHRLFLGTGEFDPAANWDGVLVWDRADAINGNRSPNRLVDMGLSGVNFGHMIYYRKSSDELYVTSLFTDEIMVFANAASMNGPQLPARVLSGALTELREPHGLWIDETRDILYVANRLPSSGVYSAVVAFHNASLATGNIAPDRSIAGAATKLDQPFNVFVDEARDYLYIANANGADANRGIVIYHNASGQDGDVAPHRQIAGSSTPFYSTHPTVHNVFLDLVNDHMYVANHQDEVYVFHNASTADGNIGADRTLSGFDNALGLFYLPDEDILYVSDGPGPVGCSSSQQVKAFYNASTLTGAVGTAPDRNIQWAPENCQYYPPQPLAVDVTCTGGLRGRLKIAYGSGANDDRLKVSTITDAAAQPDPQNDGVQMSFVFDTAVVNFGLPGGGDARWSGSDPATGRYVWDDPSGSIGGITRYSLRPRSTAGEYRITILARDIDLATTSGSATAYGELDHAGSAECSGVPDMACISSATRLKCRD
jgi:hypothetical protein